MRTPNNSELICPKHRKPLADDGAVNSALSCPSGCHFSVVRGIPRFVEPHNYARSFGLQWNRYVTTQLDSHTKTTISRDRLARIVGGLDVVRGQTVLEVGCGAGRFTEIMLEAGAKVFACDLSSAVEANFRNCYRSPNYFICQADVHQLPVAPESFDIVLCVGVIQHTPDPEKTIQALCRYVKPGGMLAIDHYGPHHRGRVAQRLFRFLVLCLPPSLGLRVCEAVVAVLWPLHAFIYRHRDKGAARLLRKVLRRVSPVIDYQEAYPQLSSELQRDWAMLDTHDASSDRYKHRRSAEDIGRCLERSGMELIEIIYAGNGVEARAKKPVSHR